MLTSASPHGFSFDSRPLTWIDRMEIADGSELRRITRFLSVTRHTDTYSNIHDHPPSEESKRETTDYLQEGGFQTREEEEEEKKPFLVIR